MVISVLIFEKSYEELKLIFLYDIYFLKNE